MQMSKGNPLMQQPGSPPKLASLASPEMRKTLALLGGFCLFLSTIEYMIPKPIPAMRIGIANLPLMLALDIVPFPAFLVLAGIKVLGQALIIGTLFSPIFLFSFASTSLSALSMFALRRLLGSGRITLVGIGAAGAMASSVSQMVMAYFILGSGVRFMIPFFLGAALVTGIALGFFCELFIRRSQWYASRKARFT